MGKYDFNEATPHKPTHPGEIILNELDARRMSKNDLSVQTGIPLYELDKIIDDKWPVSLDMSRRIGMVLGIPLEILYNFQETYDKYYEALNQEG